MKTPINSLISENSVYVAILAGGVSTRMGRDKRFLKIDGECWVDRALRLGTDLVGGNPERVLLCGEVPERNGIPDITPRMGPLGGLLTAFNCLKRLRQGTLASAWLFVFPIDMPLLNRGIFEAIASEFHHTQNPECHALGLAGNEMPFLIRYCDRTHLILEKICNDENASSRSIHTFLEQSGVIRIQVDTPVQSQLFNVNKPGDWSAISEKGTP